MCACVYVGGEVDELRNHSEQAAHASASVLNERLHAGGWVRPLQRDVYNGRRATLRRGLGLI